VHSPIALGSGELPSNGLECAEIVSASRPWLRLVSGHYRSSREGEDDSGPCITPNHGDDNLAGC